MNYRRTFTLSLPAVVLGAAMIITAFMSAAFADDPYCPNPAHAKARPAPAALAGALAKAFNVDPAAAGAGAYVRCVGDKLMGCLVGANLNCGQADIRRFSAGAAAWCRRNPGAAVVPMSATGHDTVYSWSCEGRSAVAGKPAVTIDAQGFVADNWKELPR